eukprot:TRINITY_DN1135_c0_g2_i1.p1 TRINITY_DN1135_c0_g2~~TRINITY_DN1135_c0_g2_i1.p1  ORF type:complete len:212 (+),score=60.50 TRINITY_DN1135_c0_g2_i1:45-638(+)
MTDWSNFTVVTGSKNKLREITAILGRTPAHCALDVDEIQGSADEVIEAKAKAAAQQMGSVVLVEDVSLFFHGLGGMPGPFIKYFVSTIGPHGLHRMLTGTEDKSAEARCSMALCAPDGEIKLFIGKCNGTIVEPRGPDKFGFDPCFQPEGHTETYAEMAPELKNTLSHRGRALALLKEFVDAQANNSATASSATTAE